MPHLVAHCSSDEESNPISITGKFDNIEYKYHIDPQVLGTGHHGSVRQCTNRASGLRFAVKSIRKNDPNVKPAGLAREISLLREMKHDNVVELVEVFEDSEYVHLVTDLCEGGELFDKIVEKSCTDNGSPCFTESEAARIMHQILSALSYMHKKGVAHRDIKPENILFKTNTADDENSSSSSSSPVVKIIDFGLSRKHFANSEPAMSTIVGTPYYIAPEVLRKRYDKSCDLWSVGVIAYILLCGYPPFNGTSNDQTHRCVLKGRYYFPQEDWEGISSEAVDFIKRMLKTDPRKRMTLEQALNHPWIVKHVNVNVNVAKVVIMNEEDQLQDHSSVEVVYSEKPRKKRTEHLLGGSPPRSRRKVRMSMFGL